MTLKDRIKQKIMKFLGLERLSESPNDERLTFISNDDEIKLDEIRADRIWYIGNGDELLNYYTQRDAGGFSGNPVYNRNKRQYFWAQSAQECDIKRIHSGIPNAIVSTIGNVIGAPTVDESTGRWKEIAEVNDFTFKLTQQSRPLTMVEGFGGWKINMNADLCRHPLLEFYDAEYVEYVYKCGILVGMVFKSYYRKNDKNYVLLETRYVAQGNSYIDYELYLLKKSNEIEKADLGEIPELDSIPRDRTEITGLGRILAVPSRYFYDPQNPKYGKSIYAGKLDMFDMLDEIWSQASQTNRVSTPVEYYSPDVLERDPNGYGGAPRLYNRQFMQKSGLPDGDGNMSQDIITTQPELNFDKYGVLAHDVLSYILTGILSPATMGIDVAKKDNAEAQREKEKVTIMMRNNIITAETAMVREIVDLCVLVDEYMESGVMTLTDHSVSVKYNEFANPSFEEELGTLGPAWVNGEISTGKYVGLLWGDKLSDEEKEAEIKWLDENRGNDGLDLGDIENDITYGHAPGLGAGEEKGEGRTQEAEE